MWVLWHLHIDLRDIPGVEECSIDTFIFTKMHTWCCCTVHTKHLYIKCTGGCQLFNFSTWVFIANSLFLSSTPHLISLPEVIYITETCALDTLASKRMVLDETCRSNTHKGCSMCCHFYGHFQITCQNRSCPPPYLIELPTSAISVIASVISVKSWQRAGKQRGGDTPIRSFLPPLPFSLNLTDSTRLGSISWTNFVQLKMQLLAQSTKYYKLI